MKIVVNEQAQTFYLSSINLKTGKYKWNEAVGHGLKIGEYEFCAIPTDSGINISEVSTGSKLITYPITNEMLFATETKDDFIKYLYGIGKRITEMIKGITQFDEILLQMQKKVNEILEERPASENFDLEESS